jgi:hypothetical protein
MGLDSAVLPRWLIRLIWSLAAASTCGAVVGVLVLADPIALSDEFLENTQYWDADEAQAWAVRKERLAGLVLGGTWYAVGLVLTAPITQYFAWRQRRRRLASLQPAPRDPS